MSNNDRTKKNKTNEEEKGKPLNLRIHMLFLQPKPAEASWDTGEQQSESVASTIYTTDCWESWCFTPMEIRFINCKISKFIHNQHHNCHPFYLFQRTRTRNNFSTNLPLWKIKKTDLHVWIEPITVGYLQRWRVESPAASKTYQHLAGGWCYFTNLVFIFPKSLKVNQHLVNFSVFLHTNVTSQIQTLEI